MIIVDESRLWPSKRYKGLKLWCHLASTESFTELHDFAHRIEIKRCWFHKHHYDLTPGKRAQAVRAGAVEVICERLSLTMFKGDKK